VIAFDLETHKVQPGLLAPPIVCGAWWDGDDGKLAGVGQTLFVARGLLLHKGIICGANIAYDFGCLAAADPSLLPLIFDKYERGEVFDVLIAQYLDAIAHGYLREGMIIDPRTGGQIKHPDTGKQAFRYSLAVVTDLCLNRKDAKQNDRFRTSYALLDGIPISEWPEDARQYPLDDVRNTYEVAEYQLKNHRNLHDMPFQARAAFASHLAAMWGLRTNPERTGTLHAELDGKYAAAFEKFKAAGIYRDDGSKDTKKLKELVTAAYLGQPPTTEKGAVSTARDVLAESGDELLEQFADVSKVEKLKNTYLPFVEQGTEKPINLAPNPLLANGRQSYDGLVQLLPRKGGIRECFEPRPGHVWCSVDYSAIELSTLAQVCLWAVGFSKLAEAINEGVDPHSLFAARLGNEDYEAFRRRVDSEDAEARDLRQMTKAANFGYPGMMGAPRFAIQKRKEGLKLCLAARIAEACGVEKVTEWKGRPYPPVCKACVEQAERLRIAYLERWPEMPPYFNWVMTRLDSQAGELEQFVSRRVRGGLSGPSGANTLFSGLAADGAKRALWAVSKECYLDRASPLFGSRVLIFAHDELILEMPEERAHEAAHRQAEVMVAEMKKCVPDVRVSAEPALMRRWYKDAKAVYTEGRLAAWEPK
jgi:DNA polymerase I